MMIFLIPIVGSLHMFQKKFVIKILGSKIAILRKINLGFTACAKLFCICGNLCESIFKCGHLRESIFKCGHLRESIFISGNLRESILIWLDQLFMASTFPSASNISPV
jgi:hypothetical protein